MQDQAVLLEKLAEDWTAAELHGDTGFLEGVLAGDFVGVGPRGFTLTKGQWLSRHEAGNLRSTPCRTWPCWISRCLAATA